MTAVESKGLKKGNRVYWRGDATDGGIMNALGCSHDHLGQWSCGHRTPWGHARNPASARKAYYCVDTVSLEGVMSAYGPKRTLASKLGIDPAVGGPKRTLASKLGIDPAVGVKQT